jgi:molybdopterin-containing oxidoreductase family iron-sulfur binding subunit
MPPLMPDRRHALKLLATAAATAGCSPPDEEIIPYADMPEGLVAGEPRRFATTLSLSGFGRGFLGICVDGRPIKIEGNPGHPFSLGATDVFAEGEVLSLYDLDRSKVVRRKDQIATWNELTESWKQLPTTARIGLLTGRIVSPTTLLRISAMRKRYPAFSWYRYEPVHDDAERAGARLAFGRVVTALPDWQAADRVLCLDADPLGHGPDQLRIAHGYGARRAGTRARLHVVEPAWTLTGAAADFRLALRPELIPAVGCAIANQMGAGLPTMELPDAAHRFAARAAEELHAAHARALVLTGPAQPPELHALCHWINHRLAAPVIYRTPVDSFEADHAASLKQLADDLHGHRLDGLIVLDANPAYDAPDGWEMARSIAALPYSLHAGCWRNETAAACIWHAPLNHVLESWADARALDGTASVVQPLIRSLHDTRAKDELLALMAEEPVPKAHDLVRATWRGQAEGEFESWWQQVLHDGVIPATETQTLSLGEPRLPQIPAATSPSGLTLVLSPHPALWDGRFANNAWLQECPATFSKQVWGNALSLAPEDAARLGVADGDTVAITVAGQTVLAPVTVMRAQAEGILASHWGHGRTQAGRIGSGVGIRWIGLGATAFSRRLTDLRMDKAATPVGFRSTQIHTKLNGRAEELFKIAGKRTEPTPAPSSILKTPPRGDYAWAMVIDTDACIGCNACVVACQAENNVPVVGPDEISQGRDMHWLRVDAYALPQDGTARQGFQPVPCMHCELAPCEPVCPVEASVHDHEGLNVQVYNRCIGTRFCEANCPYKVRRFNWFAYAGEQAYAGEGPTLKAQHNPDVSARGRGVMEKCNYCLQRVSRARKTAEKEDRPIREGEMVTACQAACPTKAIHFGDLNRPDADVSRQREQPRHYTLLAELNTRPRTTYLERVYADDEEQPA